MNVQIPSNSFWKRARSHQTRKIELARKGVEGARNNLRFPHGEVTPTPFGGAGAVPFSFAPSFFPLGRAFQVLCKHGTKVVNPTPRKINVADHYDPPAHPPPTNVIRAICYRRRVDGFRKWPQLLTARVQTNVGHIYRERGMLMFVGRGAFRGRPNVMTYDTFVWLRTTKTFEEIGSCTSNRSSMIQYESVKSCGVKEHNELWRKLSLSDSFSLYKLN